MDQAVTNIGTTLRTPRFCEDAIRDVQKLPIVSVEGADGL